MQRVRDRLAVAVFVRGCNWTVVQTGPSDPVRPYPAIGRALPRIRCRGCRAPVRDTAGLGAKCPELQGQSAPRRFQGGALNFSCFPGSRGTLAPGRDICLNPGMLRSILWLLPLLALVGCGDLPEPFLGNPGANGRILARPPTPRLGVPPAGNALLPDAGSQALATDLAHALQAKEVPAVADEPGRTEWRLVATAAQRGETVVPSFTVIDPTGKERGKTEGAAVPIADWAAAAPATLRQSAAEAAPKIAELLTSIETAREIADPNSLYNRRAKVMIADVTGAPGDGNETLTRQMRTHLALLGPTVQPTATGADYSVQGQVKAVPIPDRKQRIEVQWIIKNAAGQDLGRVVQLNEIPAGTLDHYWGDVAVVVATEASGGVNDVIKRQTQPDPGQKTAPGQQPGAPIQQSGASDQQPGVLTRQPGTPNQQSGAPIQQAGAQNVQAVMPNAQAAVPNAQAIGQAAQPAAPATQPSAQNAALRGQVAAPALEGERSGGQPVR